MTGRESTRPRFVIGCGTGRCGTASLAGLLRLQPRTVSTHESKRLPWHFDPAACAAYADALHARAVEGQVVADVGFYLLPYLTRLRPLLPGLRVICLERARDEVVESYMRKVPHRNHWTAPTSRHWRGARLDPVWDPCYPGFDAPKREAIGRYWDTYARACRGLEGDWLRLQPTAGLNDPDQVDALLAFAGYGPDERRPMVGIRLNAGPDGP